MDPTQCLIDLLSSLDCCGPDNADSAEAKACNREEAIEGLRNLADGLAKGGFAPKLQDVLDGLWGQSTEDVNNLQSLQMFVEEHRRLN